MSEAKAETDQNGAPHYVVCLHNLQRGLSGAGIYWATADLKKPLADHKAGKSVHTAKFLPWKLVWYSAFPDKYKALEFKKYLKSHSGKAFANKRLK